MVLADRIIEKNQSFMGQTSELGTKTTCKWMKVLTTRDMQFIPDGNRLVLIADEAWYLDGSLVTITFNSPATTIYWLVIGSITNY